MPKRKPLKELHVGGVFTEDRGIWTRELQRHCEEVDEDVDETNKKQENRTEDDKIKKTSISRKKGESMGLSILLSQI